MGFGMLGDMSWTEAPTYYYPREVLRDQRPGVAYVFTVELYPVNLGAEGADAWGSLPIMSLPIGSAASVESFFFASREWATSPTDCPPNKPFDGRINDALRFTRSLTSTERFAGLVLGGGSITIGNSDGAYDGFITGYGLDGRRVAVKVGRIGDPYSSFVTIFEGTARDWRGDIDTIEIILRDNGFKLDVAAQPNLYAGTGGDEGDSEVSGKRRPLLLGKVQHGGVTPVDPALLIYQVSDGAIDSAIEILDSGEPLTPNGAPVASYAALEAIALAPGEYEVWPAGGYVKLGASPAGLVTFRGAHGFAMETTSDLIRQLLSTTTLLDPQELEEDTFTDLETLQPADVGILVDLDSSDTTADVVAELLRGIGAFGAFNREGRFIVGRVEEPSGDPIDRVGIFDIRELNRLPLPETLSPPPWRMRTVYQRNYQVMKGALVDAVTGADRAALESDRFLASASDPTILTAHPLANDATPVESYFDLLADAENEAERLLFLFSSGRALWRMIVPVRGLEYELGNIINVSFNRLGLAGGRNMVVLDTSPQLGAGGTPGVEIVAYG